jgi:Beta/Gamma crystallin
MKVTMKALLVAAGVIFAGQAAAQVRLYQDDGFRGQGFSVDHPIENFADRGFNDKASSAEVRGGSWQVCTDAYFQGRCVVLRPGRYPSLGSMGLNDQISSIRPLERYGRADERDDRYSDRDRYADRPSDDRYYDRRDRYGDWNRQ